jgi:hypothetical protein
VIAAVVLTGAVLVIAGGMSYFARLVHTGNLDAFALAEKVAVPNPVSALDWPELRVRAVIPQPDQPAMVMLHVGWPAHPERSATLLIRLGGGDERSLRLLWDWCAASASISPIRRGEGNVELRRRQSLDRVRGLLIAEDTMHESLGSRWPAAHSGGPSETALP